MTSYFTPIIIAGNGHNIDFYVEELPYSNSLRRAHESFGLTFKTYEEAWKKGQDIVIYMNKKKNVTTTLW